VTFAVLVDVHRDSDDAPILRPPRRSKAWSGDRVPPRVTAPVAAGRDRDFGERVGLYRKGVNALPVEAPRFAEVVDQRPGVLGGRDFRADERLD